MATNLMKGLRIQNARNLINSFNSPDGNPKAYVFIGKPTVWDNNSQIPSPDNSLVEHIDVHNEILSMKSIRPQDAYHMIRRQKWASGVTYDIYAHDVTRDKRSYSGATTLYDSNYYVINSEKDVYVCLNNNRNSASTDEPRNNSGEPFYTSDGYQWMMLYRLNPVLMTNNSTDTYMPIVESHFDQRIPGEVLTVTVENSGTDYTDMPNGAPNRVRAYYCRINGDGKAAVAKVYVNGTFIEKVEVVRFGYDYTFGSLDFSRGRVYKSLYDLDNDRNGLDPEGNDDFVSNVIISPVNGWRFDLPAQLGGTTVGVFSNMIAGMTDFLDITEFRQIGVIQDPVLAYDADETLSGTYAIKTLDASDGNFLVGEEIQQEVDGGVAKGLVVYWSKDHDVLRYIQKPELHLDNGNLYRFSGTEVIIGQTSKKIDVADTTFNGDLLSTRFSQGYAVPEYTRGTGQITYLSNLPAIERTGDGGEHLAIMFRF